MKTLLPLLCLAFTTHAEDIGRFQVVPVEVTRLATNSRNYVEVIAVEKTVIKIDTATGESWQYQNLNTKPIWRPIAHLRAYEGTNEPPVKIDIDQFKLPK